MAFQSVTAELEIILQSKALVVLSHDSDWKQYFRNQRLLISNTKHYTSKRPPFCANDFNFRRYGKPAM